MPLQINQAPDHQQFSVEGVLCVNCGEFTPGIQDWCIGHEQEDGTFSGCGSNALAYVEAGGWLGGSKPHPTHPHYVEHQLASGIIAYTRLTKQEIAEKQKADKELLTKERDLAERLAEKEGRKAAAREVVKLQAANDPHWKAVAELLGVELEG